MRTLELLRLLVLGRVTLEVPSKIAWAELRTLPWVVAGAGVARLPWRHELPLLFTQLPAGDLQSQCHVEQSLQAGEDVALELILERAD